MAIWLKLIYNNIVFDSLEYYLTHLLRIYSQLKIKIVWYKVIWMSSLYKDPFIHRSKKVVNIFKTQTKRRSGWSTFSWCSTGTWSLRPRRWAKWTIRKRPPSVFRWKTLSEFFLYRWTSLSGLFLSANSLIHISKMPNSQSKCVFLSTNSVFADQNSGTYLPRITRPTCTVTPVYNGHPRDPKFVVDRWSLFRGYKILNWDFKMVVAEGRWSLTQVWMYFLEFSAN